MKIKLMKMKIRNFKAVKEFDFNPEGENASIYGQMGTGKSTIYDAFWFALFGKNSLGDSKFQWKPKDKNNESIHHLETEIQLVLEVNGEEVTLSRMVSENWVRKTGSSNEEYQGDVTTCRINGLKKKVSDYKKYIDSLIDEETFKQLTNVYYFSDVMKDKERRKMLFELVGNLDDNAVIHSKKSLEPLKEFLKGISVDDKREQLIEERSKTNADIKEWDIRIDEADRNIPIIDDLNEDELKKEKEESLQKEDSLYQELSTLKNGGFISKKRSELSECDSQIMVMKNDYQLNIRNAASELIEKKQTVYSQFLEAKNKVQGLYTSIRDIQGDKDWTRKQLVMNEKQVEELRNEYKKIHSKQIEPFDEHVLVCTYCNRPFDEEEQEDIQATYEEEAKTFNTKKAENLESINETGKAVSEKTTQFKEDIEGFDEKIEKLEKQSEESEQEADRLYIELKKLERQIEEKKTSITPFEETEAYIEMIQKKKMIQSEIDNEQQSIATSTVGIQEEIKEVKENIARINEDLSKFTSLGKSKERKDDLISEQKEKTIRAGEIEKWLFLLDEFTRTKVSLLTERINSEFEITQFKLFEPLQNGSLKEVCEPLFKGLEFTGAISNGERVNVGIDIINTISRLKGVHVPIFIDNAESVTVWHIEPSNQAIKLIAQEGQTKLNIKNDKGAA
ncbi:AAA family ATPase [Jeotgalibaca sp. MA1X17-3]|uniref:AAA family ATPase n=1 Tax=Jeotgalibaca sp. MA1X17-3 TaxID=2908211 RepID=UPI001F3002BB|nr:AAA family ATPase [Jeotgalibaca sp. MA1X17-3]UJF15091.1 AAA family ATPase [Jeotgalibaca sp. MA1X17-3]